MHPNYKSLKLVEKYMPEKLSDFNIEIALTQFEQDKILPYSHSNDEANDSSNSNECSSIDCSSDDSLMDKIVKPKRPKVAKQSIVSEYREFQQSQIDQEYQNPLEFWKDSQQYPNLQIFSKFVFSVQARSAEPERHNSSAGLTFTELRNRLDPSRLEELVIHNEILRNC